MLRPAHLRLADSFDEYLRLGVKVAHSAHRGLLQIAVKGVEHARREAMRTYPFSGIAMTPARRRNTARGTGSSGVTKACMPARLGIQLGNLSLLREIREPCEGIERGKRSCLPRSPAPD